MSGSARSFLPVRGLLGAVRACILVRVTPGSERAVADAVDGLESVEDAFPVLGQPEVVARVRIPQLESLGSIVSRVSEIDDVVVSETLLEIPEEAVA